MNDEKHIDLEFPPQGLDQIGEFGVQNPDTAAVGVNVVYFEPSSGRGRGGSRSGQEKFIDQRLPL